MGALEGGARELYARLSMQLIDIAEEKHGGRGGGDYKDYSEMKGVLDL